MKLQRTIEQAMPLLLRVRVIDAVLETQIRFGSPVTAQEVRSGQRTPLMRHTRALTELCHDITQLGPDEYGRRLHCAGRNRERLLVWWVEEKRKAPPPQMKKKRAKKKRTAKSRTKKKRGG